MEPQSKSEEKSIELKSEEIDEVLGKPPTWILRNGIIVFFFFIIVLFLGSWFIKYPDIVSAPVLITSANPPMTLVARSGGKLMYFKPVNNQVVTKGEYLAMIENSTTESSIDKLRFLFNVVDTGKNMDSLNTAIRKSITDLGVLQQPYENYLQSVKNFWHYDSLKLNEKKKGALHQELIFRKQYLAKLQVQRYLQVLNLKIAQKIFQRDSILFHQTVIAEANFDESQSKFFEQKANYENSDIAVTTAQIQISQLEQQIMELMLMTKKERSSLFDETQQTYKNLKSQFNDWELTYVLKATNSGRVSLNKYWSENQTVKIGETVLAILPEKKDIPYGIITLGMENFGKIKIGERVNIKLSSYPYTEFGMLLAEVSSISPAPDQGKYFVEARFRNGLTTNFNKSLPFNQEMSGTAEIITSDMRLIERLLYPIKALYKERR